MPHTEPSNSPLNTNKTASFRNPWALKGDYDPVLHHRMQVDMPKVEYLFFRGVNPTKGVLQTTTNILLNKLKQLLITHDITTIAQYEEFCEFVGKCRIEDGRDTGTDQRGATIRPVSEAGAPNDNGGKTRPPRKDKKHAK